MDNRANNGGHSTKSKGIDRRKNEYKSAISKAITEDDIIEVHQTVRNKAVRGDIRASELLLSYTLGKATQAVEVTNTTPEWIEELLLISNDKMEQVYGLK